MVQQNVLPVILPKYDVGVTNEVVQMTSDIRITTMEMETSTPTHIPGEPTNITEVAVIQHTVTQDKFVIQKYRK